MRPAIVIIAITVSLAAVLSAVAGDRYPSVPELESGLGVHAGAQFPKQVVARGRAWSAYFIDAHMTGDGIYTVRIKLR